MSGTKLSVLKVGGSLLRDAKSYITVAEYTKRAFLENGLKPIVVVSAMKGVTDLLIGVSEGNMEAIKEVSYRYVEVAKELNSSYLIRKVNEEIEDLEKAARNLGADALTTRDIILSYGERLSKNVFVEALEIVGADAYGLDARELIVTNGVHGDAAIDYDATKKRLEEVYPLIVEKPAIPVIEGFVGKSRNGKITTLGRGGSDYTATTIASLLHIEDVYFVTEVDGILSADPRLISSAQIVPVMDYDEAVEASFHGVKGINPKTFEPLKKFYSSTVHIGSLRRFGTRIVKQLREDVAQPKILVYRNLGDRLYLAVIGKCVRRARFLVNVLELFAEEGIEFAGLEVHVNKPSLLVYLKSSLKPSTLVRLHKKLLEGGDRVEA
ncbi:MAG: hypothetical protein QXH02_08050 [Desulfurococcaceae archaeon]